MPHVAGLDERFGWVIVWALAWIEVIHSRFTKLDDCTIYEDSEASDIAGFHGVPLLPLLILSLIEPNPIALPSSPCSESKQSSQTTSLHITVIPSTTG